MRIMLLFLCLACSALISAQEYEREHFLKTDTTWTKEYFDLPTGFAQDMTVRGIEEAIFPPGWGKVEHAEFWSYIFVWAFNTTEPLTEHDLEMNLELYFDGLMDVKQKDSTVNKLPSTALLVPTESATGNTVYTGKIRVFDRFRTQKMMTLNLKAEQQFCPAQEKSIIVFRFSPATFDKAVWKKLNAIPLREAICDLN